MYISLYDADEIGFISKKIHGDDSHYNEMLNPRFTLESVMDKMLRDMQKMREKNTLDKETFEMCKRRIRSHLEEQRKKHERYEILSKPTNWLEMEVENKKGIKKMKFDSGKVLLIFDDGDELEISYEDHHGLLVSLNGNAYSDPEGL